LNFCHNGVDYGSFIRICGISCAISTGVKHVCFVDYQDLALTRFQNGLCVFLRFAEDASNEFCWVL
jgi:hypothetical protein